MRSNKPYSNVPFTKRVDYDGGAHREPQAAAGPLVCGTCGAVYLRGRWMPPSDTRAPIVSAGAERTTCRACKMRAERQVGGVLRLEGPYVSGHPDELVRLIRNEAARAAVDNPLAQVLACERTAPDILTVTTSTEHLVERLGRAVHDAFGGHIDFGFSHGNKFARAVWRHA